MRKSAESDQAIDSDNDCICIDPITECVIIDEDSNCDKDVFGPKFTSSPAISTQLENMKNKNSYTEAQFQKMNSKKGLFFHDVSKMSLFKSKENNTTSPKLRTSQRTIYNSTQTKFNSPTTATATAVSDVIIIDDSIVNKTVQSHGDCTSVDNSVEYVSWSSPKAALPDYIPINSVSKCYGNIKDDSVIFIDSTSPNSKESSNTTPKPCAASSSKSKSKQAWRHTELFTSTEKKRLNEYNQNTYNPDSGCQMLTAKRMVIVDGSNIAFGHSLNQGFSVKGLTICIEYFTKMGHEVKVIIPQYRMQRSKSSDPETLEKLQKDGKVVLTPCKNLPGKSSISYDDRFILQLAYELDAVVISNDNYRDLLSENPAFKKIIENRVIGYTWCNDIFLLPKDPYGKWGPSLQSILNRDG